MMMNVKKKKVLINVQKSIEANLNANVEKNTKFKMKQNTMLQMGMGCCRFARCPGDQIKAAGAGGAAICRRSQRSPTQKCTACHSEVNPADVHQPEAAEMSRRHWQRGNRVWEPQILSCFGSKAIIKHLSIRSPIFGNAYRRSTSTDSFRREIKNAAGKARSMV
jgi:hypothetical protein